MEQGEQGEIGDAPRTDGPPPQLSRPLEDEVRDPFAPIDPAPRRRVAPAPPPRPTTDDPFAPPFARPEAVPPPLPAPPPPRADRVPPAGIPDATPPAPTRPLRVEPVAPMPPVVVPSPVPASPAPDTSAPWRSAMPTGTGAPPAPPVWAAPVAAAPLAPSPPAPAVGGALFPSTSWTPTPAARVPAADPLDEIAFPPRPLAASSGTSLFRPAAPSPGAPGAPATAFAPAAPPHPGAAPPGPAGFPPAGPGPAGPPTLPPWPGAGVPPGPLAPGSGSSRGRRLALLDVVAVVALVGLAAVVLVGPRLLGTTDDDAAEAPETTEPPHPDVWDERVAPIAEWVAAERDLAFEHPVTVTFLSEEEYQAQAAGGEDEPTEDDASEAADEEAEHDLAMLRALGLAHGEVDLATAGETLQGEGTLAYYVPVEQVVYVRGTELTPGVRVTLAHELTHVLQDQHFDLERIADPDFDRSEGLRALAEGDATRIGDTYAEDRLTAEERTAYEQETDAAGDDAQAALDEDVPPALVAFFSAPYALGSSIVDRLTRLEGPDAIDGLLEDPPSEEELLDPSSRGTVRADAQELEVDAPEGAEQVEDDVVGPLAWYLMLASRGEPIDALRAVDGWGGDAMVSYRDGDSTCVRAVVVGDDVEATDALELALRAWAQAGPAGAATVTASDGRVRMEACDPGVDAAPAGEASTDLLALPVVRSELSTQFQEGGWPTDAADCAADRVVGSFPLAVLTSPEPPTPEQTARIEAAILSCR